MDNVTLGISIIPAMQDGMGIVSHSFQSLFYRFLM